MRVKPELQPEARNMELCFGILFYFFIACIVISFVLGFLNAGLGILLDILEIFSKK